MTLKDVYKEFSDICDIVKTSFQLSDISVLTIHWFPTTIPENMGKEMYLATHNKRNGEVVEKYFQVDTTIEELDKEFSHEVSSVIIKEI